MTNDLGEMLKSANKILLQGLASGREIGFAEGIAAAVKYCKDKAKLHAEYLPTNHCYTAGSLEQAATCGRRDECKNLAVEIGKLHKGMPHEI